MLSYTIASDLVTCYFSLSNAVGIISFNVSFLLYGKNSFAVSHGGLNCPMGAYLSITKMTLVCVVYSFVFILVGWIASHLLWLWLQHPFTEGLRLGIWAFGSLSFVAIGTLLCEAHPQRLRSLSLGWGGTCYAPDHPSGALWVSLFGVPGGCFQKQREEMVHGPKRLSP